MLAASGRLFLAALASVGAAGSSMPPGESGGTLKARHGGTCHGEVGLGIERILSAERGCYQGFTTCCVRAATSYHLGTYQTDYRRAARLFGYACDLGDGGACFQLASMHRSKQVSLPDDRDVTESLEDRGRRIVQLGCSQRDAQACFRWQESLKDPAERSRIAQLGRGILVEDCAAGAGTACAQLGSEAIRDETLAAAYPPLGQFGRACDLGDGRGCYLKGALSMDAPTTSLNDEVEAFTRACDLGEAKGCQHAGDLLGGTDGNRREPLYRRACEGGIDEACLALVNLLLTSKEAARVSEGKDLTGKLCASGLEEACTR